MEISEGTYQIPAHLTATVSHGKIVVKKRERLFNGDRCRDCAHFCKGRKVMQHQTHESYYCAVKPKVICNERGFFYGAGPGARACEKFVRKATD